MDSPRNLPAPPFTAALIIGALIPAPLTARPGGLTSGAGSTVERPGEVLAASLSDDGGVTLAGLFSRVQGVSMPGIVRLKSDGRVDDSFTAGIGISPPATVPGPGSSAATIVPCPVFQWLGPEVVMIGDPPMNDVPLGPGLGLVPRVSVWFVIDDDGIPISDVFSTVTAQEPVIPQFVEDGKLVAIVSSPDAATGRWGRKVRRLRLDTGVDDPGFDATVTGTPSQVLPADGGGMWVLENESAAFRVARLTASGARLDSVAPLDVAAVSTTLQSMPAGALAVSSTQWEWSAQTWTHRLQFVAADGTLSTPRIQTGGSAPFFIEPDGSLLVENPAPAGVDPFQSARLRVLSRELPTGVPDDTFNPVRTRRLPHRLTDGRLLADGTRRYLSNGTPDPAWTEPELVNHGTVRALLAAPGGAVIGTGDFTRVDGQPRPGIARWHADGSLDAGFIPAAATGEVRDCTVAPDGTITVLREGTLQRLRPDGTEDATFTLTKQHDATFPLDAWEEIEPLSGGEILGLTSGIVVRIPPLGNCTALTTIWTQVFNGRGLRALPDGRYFHAGRRWLANGTQDISFTSPGNIGSVPLCAVGPDKWLFHRGTGTLQAPPVLLHDDGSVDDTYTAAVAGTSLTAAAGGAGHTLYMAGGGTVVRRHADGRRDVSFRSPRLERRNESIPDGLPLLSAARNGGDGAVHSLLVHPVTGELWIAGDFTRAGTTIRTGIARLDASMPAGYAEWSNAIFQSPADADADGDGVTNWQEYAAGTDPLLPDAAESSAAILITYPLCVSAPQNPAAPEVLQTLEISADLHTWRTATGGDAVRKTVNGRAAFELAPAAAPRFVRIRYRSLP